MDGASSFPVPRRPGPATGVAAGGFLRSMEAMMPMQSDDRTNLAERVREIRREFFGEDGVPLLAEALKLPPRTWMNY